MHQVKGWWCPDYDNDLDKNIVTAPEFGGRASYQFWWFANAIPHIKNFRHALDIGAHIGLWSHMMDRCFAKVTAFEPIPSHAECFRKNLPHLELHQVALGGNSGTEQMATKGNVSLKARIEPGPYDVTVKRLDDMGCGAVDFIKIDCEGFERQVVIGGEHTIRAQRPTLIVEQKPGNTSRYNDVTGAVDLLKEWGAVVHWKHGGDYCLSWPS